MDQNCKQNLKSILCKKLIAPNAEHRKEGGAVECRVRDAADTVRRVCAVSGAGGIEPIAAIRSERASAPGLAARAGYGSAPGADYVGATICYRPARAKFRLASVDCVSADGGA